jgi:release factor glutamine methyltransferase
VTRAEALRAAAAALSSAGIADAAREARLLMRWSAGLDAAALSARLPEPLPEAERAAFEDGVRRRAARAPLSHVTGRRAFWGRDFAVTPDVLDPRPETEILIAWALERGPARRILDLGVGSGCILLTLLAEWPEAWGVGVDASRAALAVAQRSAEALGVADRARLIEGDWLSGVTERFDLVLSNPPYLATSEMAVLSPEVRAEPAAALEAGPDGLDAYRAIAAGAASALAPQAALLLEIGPTQAEAVSALMIGAGLTPLGHRLDFDHRVRCVGFSPQKTPAEPVKTGDSPR